jgi:hypothetical protein
MRSSFPIAVLLALAFGLASIAPAIATTQSHAKSHARGRAANSKARQTGKKAAPAAGRSRSTKAAAPVKPKSTGRFKTETSTGPRTKGHVHPAARAASRRLRNKTWPRLASNGDTGKVESVHLAMPPPLRGSHESLVHQNEMAEADGLERILDDSDLNDRIASGSLVPVPVSFALSVNADLPENRRYCRPWTAKFLADFSRAHSARFSGSSLEVTSAVRTVEYQRQLRHINGNAAAADGDIASPHLTGGTIDIAKAGMSAREIGWIRAWLIPLEQQGKIDVEEEFRQSCFHISVYKSYTEPKTPEKSAPLNAATMLAAHGR